MAYIWSTGEQGRRAITLVRDSPPRGPLQALGDELVMEQTPEGRRFHRICTRHQWADRGVEDPDNALRCPLCSVEFDERQGRLRYAELHTRLLVGF